MRKVILVGGFHETVELCELANVEIVGIIDTIESGMFMGYNVLGSDGDAASLVKAYRQYPLLITPDKPALRRKLAQFYTSLGFEFFSLISPHAIVSRSAKIGTGVIIQSGVNISASVTLADFVKVNSCANIMHDCTVGGYSTIAPNAVLLGRVEVGEESYIGSNSTVLPNRSVGNSVMIGAGAVVTKNIDDNAVAIGNPARVRETL
jgi:sugar O-acyltransferase (sialic acid O-acetyltransferase NeuD family)